MPITQANLKLKIAAYINRTVGELVVTSYDLCLDAMNMAKLEAQRKHNFKMARTPGFISTSMSGAAMSTITSDYAATTPLVVKYIEQMFTVNIATGTYYRGFRVPARTTGDEKLFHDSVNSAIWCNPASLPPGTTNNPIQTTQVLWWQQGLQVMVSAITPAQTFWVDTIAYLPDYDGTSGTDDFFLTYHHDWLFLESLDYINLFLKEDQRVQISSQKKEQLWNSVISYDEQFSEGAFDLDANN